MGPSSFQHFCGQRPDAPRPRRSRRCLLKGCERRFTPARPQARYCSDACRQAAQQWRRWQASRRYRASTHGQERRRAQQQALSATAAGAAEPPSADDAAARGPAPSGCAREDFAERPCDRPGCYDVFAVPPRRVVPAFLQRGLPPGVTASARSGGTLSPAATALAASTSARSAWRGRHVLKHVFRSGNLVADSLKCPDPQTEEGAGGRERVSRPPFPFFERG